MSSPVSNQEQVPRALMPEPAEIRQRLAFLGLGEADVALLRAAHARLAARRPDLAERLYRRLLRMPFLRGLPDDAAALDHLKRSQAIHCAGLGGAAHVADASAVAGVSDPSGQDESGAPDVNGPDPLRAAHQRVGLPPLWYIGAYRHYLSELMPALREALGDVPHAFQPTCDAFLKVLCLDIGLALESYVEVGQRELLSLKNYSEHIIDSMPSGLMVIDADRGVRTVNRAMADMLGLAAKGAARQPFEQAIANPQLRERIELALAQPDYRSELVTAVAPRYLHCDISRKALDGSECVVLIAEDISVSMQARADLLESEERFRLAFGEAAVGLAQMAADGRWLRVNRKLLDILGYSEQEMLARRLGDITPPEDWAADREALRRLLAGELASYERERRYLCKDGRCVWVNMTAAAMQPGRGAPSLIVAIEDIERRKQAEQDLQHLASHDRLTGLANRGLLLDRLAQAIAHARRAHRCVAVLFVDLDYFKRVNDSLGHDAGDEVLVEVARRLSAHVRDADTVARLGGDEFVVVLSDLADAASVAGPAQKMLEALLRPMLIRGEPLDSSASVGISVYPQDGRDNKRLLKQADAAMYRAKQMGRGRFQFHSPPLPS